MCVLGHFSHVQLFVTLWPARLLCPWGFSRQEYWSGLPCPPLGNLPNAGIWPRSPALWADSLLSEPPEKPKNTGVGSLSLLQGNFPTQESNWGLLHCRQILYQLSYPGSPESRLSSLRFNVHIWSQVVLFVFVFVFVWKAFSLNRMASGYGVKHVVSCHPFGRFFLMAF